MEDRGRGDEVRVRNRLEALTGEDCGQIPLEDGDDESEGHREKSEEVTRRWSRSASQRKCESKTRKGHKAVEACPEVCWLCEEYDEERLPHTGVGCCSKPKEPDHDEHICIECRSEINQGCPQTPGKPRDGRSFEYYFQTRG